MNWVLTPWVATSFSPKRVKPYVAAPARMPRTLPIRPSAQTPVTTSAPGLAQAGQPRAARPHQGEEHLDRVDAVVEQARGSVGCVGAGP